MSPEPSVFPGPACYISYAHRCDLPGVFYLFRRAFDLAALPASAVLRITGCSKYAVFVNGRLAGRGPLVSGRRCATVDAFDITPLLRPGANAVAVRLYVGLDYGRTLDFPAWVGGGFVADLLIDGVRLLATDESWRADLDRAYGLRRPRRSMWCALFEDYDARRDQPAWTEPTFDDSAWPPVRARKGGMPWVEEYEPRPEPNFVFEADSRFHVADAGLIRWRLDPEEYYWLRSDDSAYEPLAGPLPALKPGSPFASLRLDARPDAASWFRLIADEYILGRPYFDIEADPGLVLDIVWAEKKMNPDPLLSPMGRMANWARYVTRQGRQRFTFFDVHGFREIQFLLQPGAGSVRFHSIDAERQWTMRCERGEFFASQQDYARLWRAGARTAALVTTDHHSDNSFREQAPWSGDQEWTKMAVYVAEGVHPITTRQFRQFALGQARDGRFPSPYPHSMSLLRVLDAHKQAGTGLDLPDHSLGFLCSLWRHYRYSGDAALLDALWPRMVRAVEYFDSLCDSRGLLNLRRIDESWIWVDWRGLKDRSAPLNALWGAALASVAAAGRAIDRDAHSHEQRLARLRAAFIDAFWDPERNLLIDRPLHRPELGENVSQLTQAIAACFGLLPDTCDRARLGADLTALDGRLGTATPPMQGFVLSALEPLGVEERIHHLLARQWLNPHILDFGTLPEFWADNAGAIQSLCQGGGPMISWALTHYVLGIRPLAPGFSRFAVKPVPGPLNWASGKCPTPHGSISLSWRCEAGRRALTLKAPPGTVAERAPDWPA